MKYSRIKEESRTEETKEVRRRGLRRRTHGGETHGVVEKGKERVQSQGSIEEGEKSRYTRRNQLEVSTMLNEMA